MPLRPITRLLCTLLVAAGLAACATHRGNVASATASTPQSCEFSVQPDVIYTPPDWPKPLTGTVYAPDCDGPRPAVLLVHGGGWERRSPDDMAGIAKRLAARGYVVFNVAYRFAPDYVFPDQLHDVQLAVRWMRSNADALSIDPRRIAGFGYSSGAHLVLLLGLVGNEDALDTPYGGQDTRLQAVVAGGTPTDLREFDNSDLVTRFLGATFAENPQRYAQASPITHIDAGDPPVFLYHGGWDWLVPKSQAQEMFDALQAKDVPAELYVVPGYGHISMFLLNRSALRQAMDFLDRVLREPAR